MKIKITLLFCVASFFLLLFLTSNYNLGMTSDGFNYIEISRNILNGKGIVNNNGEIVNHWPPLYPISLAIISQITNLDPFESARYLQAFLLFSTFFVFNLILNRFNLNCSYQLFSIIIFCTKCILLDTE
jgi:hypothetical protein